MTVPATPLSEQPDAAPEPTDAAPDLTEGAPEHLAPGAVEPPGTSPTAKTPLGRPFTVQLGTTGLANLGDGMLAAVAPLIALTLTTSPAQISLLSAATWLPWLLFGLAAGAVIDRIDRRRAQIGALTVRAILLAGAAWLATTGHLSMPLLLGVVLAYGVTEVVADLGATSIVPDLVPAPRLPAANGRIIAVQQVTNSFVGAPAGGALLVVGVGWAVGAPAALAALAAGALAIGLRGRYRHATPSGTRPLALVREGLVFLVHHPVLRPIVIAGGLLNLASTGYFAVFVLWAVGPASAIGLAPQHYPLVLMTLAVGAVLGSLAVERVLRHVGEITLMVTTFGINAVLLLVPVIWPHAIALAASLFVVGFFNTMGNVVSQSLRQRLVPAQLLGRVGGASRTISYGLMPIGAVLGGVVAEHWGLVTTFMGAVALSLATTAFIALSVDQRMVTEAESALLT